jgi:hypothetical protein
MTQIVPSTARVSPARQAAGASAAPALKQKQGWFLEAFILAQVVLPALLFLPGTQAARVPIRMAPFGFGLLGLAFLMYSQRKVRPHPATALLILAIAYLATMIASPGTNTTMAGIAQVMLYFCVMAPVFWAPQLVHSKQQIHRILAILLICNGLNAVVGVLQVKYPDTFMPKELSTIVLDKGDDIGTYIGPNGETIIRPPGLSDSPGAVCAPASVAALLGLVLAIRPIAMWKRAFSLAMAFAGVAAIFLSHVRTSILIVCGMCLVYCMLLLLQKQGRRALTFAALAVALVAGGLFVASLLGGEAVVERFSSLVEDDPSTVYQRNRGFMLADTQRYLSDYPLGAGLGRWGMMRLYFGDEANPSSPPLWAEIQFPAWALDGGIVLLLLYMAALIVDVINQCRACASLSRTSIASDVAVIVASNAGVLALMFSFTPFTTQIGGQYWFLAGILHGVARLPRKELA